jgi:hypothetical protein
MFGAASDAEVPPYNWIPPEWEIVKANGLPDHSSDQGTFRPVSIPQECVPKADVSQQDLREKGSQAGNAAAGRNNEQTKLQDFLTFCRTRPDKVADPEVSPEGEWYSSAWPSPFSDFSHIDPNQFGKRDLGVLENILNPPESSYAQGTAKPAKAQAEAKKRGKVFSKLQQVVGPDSPGMKRLAQVYHWIIFKATDILSQINASLEDQSPENYKTATKSYLAFLKDLDDHEPQTRPGDIDPANKNIYKDKGSRSGYGAAIKWVHIDPVITGGRIRAARIIVKWNPHSSSNGVPIPHSSP